MRVKQINAAASLPFIPGGLGAEGGGGGEGGVEAEVGAVEEGGEFGEA